MSTNEICRPKREQNPTAISGLGSFAILVHIAVSVKCRSLREESDFPSTLFLVFYVRMPQYAES